MNRRGNDRKNETVVEKYNKATRILHHVQTIAFVVLFLTELVLFIPQLGFLAQDSWTRILYWIDTAVFIIVPPIYLALKSKAAIEALKEAFSRGKEDIGWLKAAPCYYFLSDGEGMPPQGYMDTGQKIWWFIVIVFDTWL